MLFGIREKKTTLGRFTSDTCEECKKGREFRMEKTTKYLVVFAVNFIPLRVNYESVCEGCDAAKAVSGSTARSLARKHFRRTQAKQQFFMALRLLIAAVVIAAAVVLPLTIRVPLSRDPDALKALVSEDGSYLIKDRDGELLAMIQVEGGVKTLVWYDKVRTLQNTGSKGGRFYLHENYQEATNGSGETVLVRDMDDPGRLLDQYNTVVRVYYYDAASDTMGFYNGVEDLSQIEYTPGKATYPSVYYLSADEKQQYVMVLYLKGSTQVRAQFTLSTEGGAFDALIAVDIDTLSGGRVTDQAYYYFDSDMMALATQEGLSPDSSAQEIMDFIAVNSVSAAQAYHYEFYRGTGVAVSEQSSLPDASGSMQTQITNYDVTQINGYYILQYADAGESDAQN